MRKKVVSRSEVAVSTSEEEKGQKARIIIRVKIILAALKIIKIYPVVMIRKV